MSSNSESKRDSLSASEYILENFEPSDRIAVLVRNGRTGETIQRITRATNAASPDFQAWLRHKNASGADIYVGMNSLKRDAQSSTKENVEKIRHLYLDIDRRGPEAVKAVENSGLVPRPNYVFETSPGKFQVIWKVEDIPQDRAEALQRAMVREFGGDPVAALTAQTIDNMRAFAGRLCVSFCKRTRKEEVRDIPKDCRIKITWHMFCNLMKCTVDSLASVVVRG